MGTITQIKGRYYARVRKRGHDLSEHFRTKGEAKAWIARTETEIEDKRLGKIPDKTFGDLLERYIREVSPSKGSHKQNAIRYAAMVKRGDPLLSVGLRHLAPEHFAETRQAFIER